MQEKQLNDELKAIFEGFYAQKRLSSGEALTRLIAQTTHELTQYINLICNELKFKLYYENQRLYKDYHKETLLENIELKILEIYSDIQSYNENIDNKHKLLVEIMSKTHKLSAKIKENHISFGAIKNQKKLENIDDFYEFHRKRL